MSQAQHFIQALQALQRAYGLTHLYAAFVASSGFQPNVQDELERHNIRTNE